MREILERLQAWQAGGYLTGSVWIRRGRRLAAQLPPEDKPWI